MEIDEIKSGAADFEGDAHLCAWLHSDDSGVKYLVLELGNSAGLGSLTTLILKQRESPDKAEQ